MEQHPVPQNVTTFQFRLIGDMTIKQFGYLAAGIILAYISYKLPLPFFFTWPLTVIFGFGGFGFAFIPIEERPMDVWVLSFLRNVYNPTVFHWERSEFVPEPALPSTIPTSGTIITNPPPPQQKMAPAVQPQSQPANTQSTLQQLFTPTSTPQSQPMPQQKNKDGLFSWLSTILFGAPKATPAYVSNQPNLMAKTPYVQVTARVQTQQQAAGTPIPEPQPDKEQRTIAELSAVKLQLEALQKELQGKTLVESRVLELQKQLSDLSHGREAMEKELIALRQSQRPSPFAPPRSTGPVLTRPGNEPTIKTMNPDVATRAGLPRLTTFPNVVTGIIKDYDNNLLPGVLVTVKDKEGIPLRALKTNKLGQFAASTQLQNGTYFVEVEDPRGRFTFDRVQITLNGAIMPALQVVAKSKRQLDREVLQKQIFGAPNAST